MIQTERERTAPRGGGDPTGRLSGAELAELKRARALLEGGGLLVRVAETLGRPLEAGLARLPAKARRAVEGATRTALERGLDVARGTMGDRSRRASEGAHKAAAATAGAETRHGYAAVREAYEALATAPDGGRM